MGRPVKQLALTLEERIELRNRVRAATTPQRDSLRARIILQRARGEKIEDVADQLGVSVACVSKWSSRFETDGLPGLKDASGRGRKPSLPKEKIEQVLTRVTQPPKGRRRWSVRTMARAVGISHDSVQRIWKANDLKPHLTRTFKLSRPRGTAEKRPMRDTSKPANGIEAGQALLYRAGPHFCNWFSLF